MPLWKGPPDLQAEDDKLTERPKVLMAKKFGLTPKKMEGIQTYLALVQKVMSGVSDITRTKTSTESTEMPMMGDSDTHDAIVRNSIAKPAAKAAHLINSGLSKNKTAHKRVAVDPDAMSSIVKELALHYGGNVVGIGKLAEHHHYTHRGDLFGMAGGCGNSINLS